MRKVQMKQMTKRVLSVLMVLCMVFAMIPAESIFAAAKRVVENKKPDETIIDVTTSEYSSIKNGKTLSRIRKIINDNGAGTVTFDTSVAKGTEKNPFLVLEVVTDYDYSSIGYLIAGCEPVDMDSLRGNEMAIKDLTGSADGGDFFGYGTWKKLTGKLYFFADEREGQITFYQNSNLTSETKSDEEGAIEPGKSKLRFDETEWDAKRKTDTRDFYGYYEVVKQGTGTFILKEENTTDSEGRPIVVRSIVKADLNVPEEKNATTLVWHTTNGYLINQYKATGEFNNLFLSMENLNDDRYFPRLLIDKQDYIGNRFYTIRSSTGDDNYYDVSGCLYEYESNDLLVSKSIVAKEADAKNYSVVLKTITPAELKANQAWAEKADLVYFNCDLDVFFDKNKDGEKGDKEAGLLDLWQCKNVNDKTLNRFQVEKTTSTKKGFRDGAELDAGVAYKLLGRVSKYSNYVALIFDSACVSIENNDTQTVTYDRYKIDDRSRIDSGFGETGYKNNLAKLWLACTSANPGFAKKYFFDGGADESGRSYTDNSTEHPMRYAVDSNGFMVFTNSAMSADEKLFWSGMSFYCADNRYSGSENVYREAYWKNYAGDTTHKYFDPNSTDTDKWKDEDRYYVQGHVFVTPTGTSLVEGFAKSYSPSSFKFLSSWGADEKYDDFNFYLSTYEKVAFKAGAACSSLATKYVIDANNLVNYYFDDSLKVLDIEPSVKMLTKDAADGGGKTNTYYVWDFDGSDVLKLIPKRIGTDTVIKPVNVEHQVMQQFIAKNEDLNSVYDLIYIGDYIGGLWSGNDVLAAGFSSSGIVDTVLVGQTTKKVWQPKAGARQRYINGGNEGVFDGVLRKANGWGENGYRKSDCTEVEVTEDIYENVYGVTGATAGDDRTDFVDDSMDGLVYFHIGDILNIKSGNRNDGGNWKNEAGYLNTANNITRQSGNDLTDKKQKKLVEYLKAEYPIVIADTLYNNSTMTHPYVDQSKQCVLKQFLDKYDPAGSEPQTYYTKDMLDKIDRMVSNRLKGRATIDEWPTIYSFNGSGSGAGTDKYLSASDGKPVLTFEVNVPNTTDYAYRVFVDRNKDSVFTEDWGNDEKNEVITPRMVQLTELKNEIQVKMPDKWVGFVQWRIEVVNKNNIYKRYSKEGCSAVAADTSAGASSDRAVQKIVALQIIPTHNSQGPSANPGTFVDLSNKALNGKRQGKINNTNWTNLYDKVSDFDITVVKMTWRQFMQVFKPQHDAGKTFKFDMGSPIDINDSASSNPNKATLAAIENTPLAFRDYNYSSNPYASDLISVSEEDAKNYYKLSDFNMIVLGFDDAYGFTDMINTYGNAEYLYYFAQKGCSILFTHDTTSAYTYPYNEVFNLGWATINVGSPWNGIETRRYGYTGNTMMREIMGLNRYMQFSKYLTEDSYFRSDLKSNIENYVKNKVAYDKGYVDDAIDGLQGYSIFNMVCYSCSESNNGSNGRIQNKYMVLNPKNEQKLYSGNSAGGTNSPYYSNTLSEVVSRVNEGQITQYPYTINTEFVVGETHGQWWQLNMEDEDLTVWYTLQDPAVSTLANSVNIQYQKRELGDRKSNYIALMYSAVPQDATNNYYIYSKGNIFYSGVGHSNVKDGEEKKLFVNTLVAAYRPKYGLPFIQVTNDDASLVSNSPRTYSISLPVDYLYKANGAFDRTEVLLTDGVLTDTNNVYVRFKAMDNNGCTEIYTKAVYDGTTTELTIYPTLDSAKSDGTPVAKNAQDDYILTVGSEYYISYPKSNLDSLKSIRFDSYNNRQSTIEKDVTYLKFSAQPLFKLD